MKFKFSALAAIAAFAFSFGASAYERIQVNSQSECSVELNGDSILFGYANNPPTDRWATTPAQWLRNYGYTVTDRTAAGLSTYRLWRGYTTPDGNPNTPPHFFPNGPQYNFTSIFNSHPSKIIVIQTGINDYRMEYSPATAAGAAAGVKQDYGYMVDYIRSLGSIPVLAGITNVSPGGFLGPHISTINAIREAVKQVSAEKSVHYASFDMNYMGYVADGVHVDQATSNGLAENLRYVVSYICSLPF